MKLRSLINYLLKMALDVMINCTKDFGHRSETAEVMELENHNIQLGLFRWFSLAYIYI